MSKSKKPKPATVSFTATQAGETQAQFPFGEKNSRWAWVESSVWTDRMLTALENGVKGGRWFSLIDKVINAGQTPTLQSLGCSAWKPPMLLSVNPLCGELPTGEPYAA